MVTPPVTENDLCARRSLPLGTRRDESVGMRNQRGLARDSCEAEGSVGARVDSGDVTRMRI